MRFSAALLSILALIAFTACSPDKKGEQAADKGIPVKVGDIRHVRDHELVSVSGTVVSPEAPVSVAFLVSGKVIKADPREGDYVKKGQLLAAIDPTDYNLGVMAASAQVKQAQTALDRAKSEYDRMKYLFDARTLPANDFDKFKAAYLSAVQQRDQAAANCKLSQKHLSDASLYAPVDGFISRRGIEPGESAGPGRPVYEMVKLDPVEISVGVPETDIHLVRLGQKATVTIPALPGGDFQGTVRVINVSADSGTRTYMTRISVPNPDHKLKIGMVAEASIIGDRILDLMTLPAEAIMRDPQGATVVFVYYPDQGRAHSKMVATGSVHGREIIIKSGLSGDESIVLAGQEKLKDGARVLPVADDKPAATEAAPESGEGRR